MDKRAYVRFFVLCFRVWKRGLMNNANDDPLKKAEMSGSRQDGKRRYFRPFDSTEHITGTQKNTTQKQTWPWVKFNTIRLNSRVDLSLADKNGGGFKQKGGPHKKPRK